MIIDNNLKPACWSMRNTKKHGMDMKKTELKMSDMIKFPYGQKIISFLSGSDDKVMVNATQMAKPFGKIPKDWLRTNQAKEFLKALATVRHTTESELVKVIRGGLSQLQGTWFHGDVAIEFARWLSPEFAIWCNDIIKALLKRAMLPDGKQLCMQQLENMDDSPEALRMKYGRLIQMGMSENVPLMKAIRHELDRCIENGEFEEIR